MDKGQREDLIQNACVRGKRGRGRIVFKTVEKGRRVWTRDGGGWRVESRVWSVEMSDIAPAGYCKRTVDNEFASGWKWQKGVCIGVCGDVWVW